MRVRWLGALVPPTLLLVSACEAPSGLQAQARSNPPAAQSQVRDQLGPIAELDTVTAFRLSNTFRAAADRALPAVVYIGVVREPTPIARRQGQPGRQGQPQGIPEEFRRFFGLPEGFTMPDDFEMRQAPQQGAGSGFILDRQGHIMTNHHVVNGATRITVRLVDGREFDARLIGSDAATDVAIVKVEPRQGEVLPVSELGRSADSRIGDWVIALGNPLGLNFTVTAGIVSAQGRQLRRGSAGADQGAPPLEAYIQTDAAINPGNSGGPLVDLYGRVIGMNTAISAQNFIGHGFAVPIDLASRIADDLLTHGYVRRPRIGVTVADVTAVDAEVYGLNRIRGAQITSVQAGLAGAQAGIQPGDVVLSIGGREIRDATDLTTTLALHQPGETLEFRIWRDRRESTVRVRLGEFPRPDRPAAADDAAPRPAERIGFSVAPVTAQEAARMGLPRENGVIIDQVTQYGPAAGRVAPRGSGAPQMLRSVNGRQVRTVAEFEAAVRNLQPGDAVSLRLVDPEAGEMVVNYRVR
jgi:serine protease Do